MLCQPEYTLHLERSNQKDTGWSGECGSLPFHTAIVNAGRRMAGKRMDRPTDSALAAERTEFGPDGLRRRGERGSTVDETLLLRKNLHMSGFWVVT
jgi:hypothetical protein